MKKNIIRIAFIHLLAFGATSICTAQIVKQAPVMTKVPQLSKVIRTNFSSLATTYRSATLVAGSSTPKPVVPVAEKQYVMDLCSNTANSDIKYIAYMIYSSENGYLTFLQSQYGDGYLDVSIDAKADGYYLVEMNINTTNTGASFFINQSGKPVTNVKSTGDKLSFLMELRKGRNNIMIGTKESWAFANAQITLLKK